MQRNGFIAGFFGMICLAFFIFRGYRQKQKANIEISRQKGIIEIKNKETLDSIHYAKRIQKALFASDLLLRKNLDDYFVLHKPKDIVSGDFYWAFRTPDQFLLCVADCTGHGVPGAFMSLLNISFLNEITIEKRITRPDLVLDGLRTSIIHALNTEGNEQSQDGMDGIFCSFDFEKRIISYASANNNFYLIRNNTLIHGETDKMPVGKSPKDDQLFKLHTAEFQTGDLFYALTDGYADQFGGEKGKKFMYKRLEELLLTNAKLPLEKQKNILDTTLENWKGNLEQVDDICILGVRL